MKFLPCKPRDAEGPRQQGGVSSLYPGAIRALCVLQNFGSCHRAAECLLFYRHPVCMVVVLGERNVTNVRKAPTRRPVQKRGTSMMKLFFFRMSDLDTSGKGPRLLESKGSLHLSNFFAISTTNLTGVIPLALLILKMESLWQSDQESYLYEEVGGSFDLSAQEISFMETMGDLYPSLFPEIDSCPQLLQEDQIPLGITSEYDPLLLFMEGCETTTDSSTRHYPLTISPSLLERSQTARHQFSHAISTSAPTSPEDSKDSNRLVQSQASSPLNAVSMVTSPTKSRTKKLRPCDIRKEMRKVEKPEKCDKCGRGFAQARDLRRHIAVHERSRATHLGISYEKVRCKVMSCKETFARQDHLTRHLKNKHGLTSRHSL